MPYTEIAILAGFVCLYSAAAGRIERSPINGALVFVAFGFLAGPDVLEIFAGDVDAPALRIIAEIALALLLYVEASKADLAVLSRSSEIPTRLILIALPLVIAFGFGAGLVIFEGMSVLGVAILATILAPTDAALGKPVVTNKRVPSDIREGLNFESGLNDGVCVPIFLAFLTLATSAQQADSFTSLALTLIVQEIGIGAIVGLAITAVAAQIIQYCYKNGWVHESWMQLPVVATAIACFAAAQSLHGSGFIAAFVGGLLFGWLARKDTHELVHSAEGTGDTFAMITWVIFGTVLGQVAGAFTWQVLIYSIFALTFMRMIPVALSLSGLPLTFSRKLFIGWFGPRGLATIVFAMMVFQNGLPEADLIVATAACTVLLSVIAHGVSALPFIGMLFGRDEGASERT